MPLWSEVRDDVCRVSRDLDRRLEERLLPAARLFIAEGHGAEQRSRAGPQMPHVRAAIRGASFVKPDAGNEAVTVGTEFQPEFDSATIVFVGIGWRRPTPPHAAWTWRPSRSCECPC